MRVALAFVNLVQGGRMALQMASMQCLPRFSIESHYVSLAPLQKWETLLFSRHGMQTMSEGADTQHAINLKCHPPCTTPEPAYVPAHLACQSQFREPKIRAAGGTSISIHIYTHIHEWRLGEHCCEGARLINALLSCMKLKTDDKHRCVWQTYIDRLPPDSMTAAKLDYLFVASLQCLCGQCCCSQSVSQMLDQ